MSASGVPTEPYSEMRRFSFPGVFESPYCGSDEAPPRISSGTP